MYYYSGNVRKRFVSQRQLQIEAQKKALRRENFKNILLVTVLIACILMAGHLDHQSLQEGIIH
jgi:hypothetical protein